LSADDSVLDSLPPPAKADDSILATLPPPEGYDPSTGGSTLKVGPFDTGMPIGQGTTRFLAGVGKAGYDLARGAGQWLGLESRGDVAESRKLDAPLMATTAGKAGDIAGSAAFAAPAMLIPGAQGPMGAAAIGAVTGALQPSTSTAETAENIGLGAGGGAAGSLIGGKIADIAGAVKESRNAAAQSLASLSAERDATLAAGRAAGYVVPPTAVNPGAVNTALESISGKAATRQAAAETNQKVTNTLVRQDLGLASDAPITAQALAGVRAQAGKAYEAVRGAGTVASDQQYANDLQAALTGSPQLQKAYPGIGGVADPKLQDLVQSVSVPQHDASSMVDAIKMVRNKSSANFKSAFASGDPDLQALARGQQDVADSMEDLLKRHLQANGQQDLADAFDAARTTIAKSYSAQAALNGNNVSAANLAAQARRGKPMSEGLDLAAQFGTHFPEVAGLPSSGVGVSKLSAAVAGAGELGAAYLHSPTMAAGSAAMAAAPYVTRGAILSGPGQSLLARPSYAPGLMGTAALNTLQGLGRRGALTGAVPLSQLMTPMAP
jgi:hypothetical protein